MSTFEEPDTLAVFDRSYGDSKQELRLERGEYNGRPTYALRLYWQTPDGQWRWSAAKPSQSGKCWQSMSLKAKELRALGEALIAEASGAGAHPTQRRSRQTPPREQRELDRFDANAKVPAGDDDIPF